MNKLLAELSEQVSTLPVKKNLWEPEVPPYSLSHELVIVDEFMKSMDAGVNSSIIHNNITDLIRHVSRAEQDPHSNSHHENMTLAHSIKEELSNHPNQAVVKQIIKDRTSNNPSHPASKLLNDKYSSDKHKFHSQMMYDKKNVPEKKQYDYATQHHHEWMQYHDKQAGASEKDSKIQVQHEQRAFGHLSGRNRSKQKFNTVVHKGISDENIDLVKAKEDKTAKERLKNQVHGVHTSLSNAAQHKEDHPEHHRHMKNAYKFLQNIKGYEKVAGGKHKKYIGSMIQFLKDNKNKVHGVADDTKHKKFKKIQKRKGQLTTEALEHYDKGNEKKKQDSHAQTEVKLTSKGKEDKDLQERKTSYKKQLINEINSNVKESRKHAADTIKHHKHMAAAHKARGALEAAGGEEDNKTLASGIKGRAKKIITNGYKRTLHKFHDAATRSKDKTNPEKTQMGPARNAYAKQYHESKASKSKKHATKAKEHAVAEKTIGKVPDKHKYVHDLFAGKDSHDPMNVAHQKAREQKQKESLNARKKVEAREKKFRESPPKKTRKKKFKEPEFISMDFSSKEDPKREGTETLIEETSKTADRRAIKVSKEMKNRRANDEKLENKLNSLSKDKKHPLNKLGKIERKQGITHGNINGIHHEVHSTVYHEEEAKKYKKNDPRHHHHKAMAAAYALKSKFDVTSHIHDQVKEKAQPKEESGYSQQHLTDMADRLQLTREGKTAQKTPEFTENKQGTVKNDTKEKPEITRHPIQTAIGNAKTHLPDHPGTKLLSKKVEHLSGLYKKYSTKRDELVRQQYQGKEQPQRPDPSEGIKKEVNRHLMNAAATHPGHPYAKENTQKLGATHDEHMYNAYKTMKKLKESTAQMKLPFGKAVDQMRLPIKETKKKPEARRATTPQAEKIKAELFNHLRGTALKTYQEGKIGEATSYHLRNMKQERKKELSGIRKVPPPKRQTEFRQERKLTDPKTGVPVKTKLFAKSLALYIRN